LLKRYLSIAISLATLNCFFS